MDLAIARRIVAGDEGAFRELFDRFFPRLYRFVLARVGGDGDVADEIVQASFCRAFERLDSYRGESSLYTWFCQICRNAVVDHWRSGDHRAAAPQLLEDHPDVRVVLEALEAPALERPDAMVWRHDLSRLIQATVDSLPGNYGEILEWKYVDGLSVADIAERLTLTVKAAESQLQRARTAFRTAILSLAGSSDALTGGLV